MEEERELEPQQSAHLGAYGGEVRLVESASEEIMLLWGLGQPAAQRQNAFVRQSSHTLSLDSCARRLTLLQSPSSMSTPGVTGAVMWDSGVVLAKFLEHAVDSGQLTLRGTKVVELGAGCGLVGIVAAFLGADVVLTDLPDRLKLLKKNVDANIGDGLTRGSARVSELIWGDEIDLELIEPSRPDFVIGSDVIYSEAAVDDLLKSLKQLCGPHTTILLAGELRNDVVLELFFEAVMEDFTIGCIDQQQWHPDFTSNRVALFVLAKKVEAPTQNDFTKL